MPRRKNWKRCEKKKEDWRKKLKTDGQADRETSRVESGDGGGSDSADRYDSPPERGAGSPPRVVAGSPSRVVAGSPSRVVAGSPSRVVAGKKGNKGNTGNTGGNKQLHAETDEETDISMLKQVITDLNLLIANVSSNVQTDFDTVILEAFPDTASDCHFRVNKES